MKPSSPPSIGSATLRTDGVLELMLRVEGPGGIVGDSLVTYAPDDPHYQQVLAHLGGIKVGEVKPVAPFPD
jgi:hypothetical protein